MTETNWIFDQNLRSCLQIAASETGTEFGDNDWEAIRYGLRGTSDIADRWFEYQLTGSSAILRISCALDDGNTSSGIIHIRFGSDGAISLAKLATILSICSEYTITRSTA